MVDFKPATTPLVPNEHLHPATHKEQGKFKSLKIDYHSTVGSINYLNSATFPDFSFAVSTLSQYLEIPGIHHWQDFLHVLCYLMGTQDVGLRYPRGGNSGIVSWSDAYWKIAEKHVAWALAT
ncbi:hypothetical protein O181_007464 [Austropuccinia psidii MF-1]|uniref:Uncharacterized protein n=1 Tax=Austropuccinia psidii MF-1 TaxID=1389203 RepID=A0A9Q3BM06_9BASI|nr:hypothetical protein [Austropuccinia psidii MF-1]